MREPRLPLAARVKLAHRLPTREFTSWPQIVPEVLRRSPALLTLDVFDTLIFRDLLGDDNVEHEICRQLGLHQSWSSASADFGQVRANARSERPEGSTRDWLDSHHASRWAESPAALLALERDIERDWSHPAPGVLEALARFRTAGITLSFVSDMHLSSAQLRPMLERHSLISADEDLWVSCEHGASKHQGGLWPLVAGTSDRSKMLHIGNNRWADISQARAHGIEAIFYTELNPTASEQAQMDLGIDGGWQAAAARRQRLGLDEVKKSS